MSIVGAITRALSIRADSRGPLDDFWYGPARGGMTAAGVRVGQDTADKLSAWFRGRQLVAGTVAMLPLEMFVRRPDGGKDVALTHPVRDLLRSRPNPWQTSLEWRQLMNEHVIDRGNGYSLIGSGPRGAVDHLIPLNPDQVTPELQSDYTMKYRWQPDKGPQQTIFQDEMFHLPGMAYDGVKGKAILDVARESLGIGLAQEQYAARLYSQSEVPPIVLTAPGAVTDQTRKANKAAWTEATATWNNRFRAALLEGGWDVKTLNTSLTAEQVQLIEAREFSVTDIARWLGIPPHMLGETTKETSWGSGIEQMSIGFVTYTLLWWLRRWEQRISSSLLLAPDRFFAEHNVDGLLRGDAKSRAEALAILRSWGIINANQWRALENMNPTEDGQGDTYLWPANYAPAGTLPATVGPSGAATAGRALVDALAADSARNTGDATARELAAWLVEHRNGAATGGH